MTTTTKKTGRTTPRKSAADTVTPVKGWKSKTVGGTLLTVPSGNTALVRAPGMEAFIKAGVIPNGLMSIVQEAMIQGGPPSDDAIAAMMADTEKISQILELAGAVTMYCCIDPKVAPVPLDDEGAVIPLDDERRDEDILYVDEVDFNDKMFIFNFAVGGSADLEQFRT